MPGIALLLAIYLQWVGDLKKLRTNFVKPYIEDAPYIILVFKQSYGIRPDGKRQPHYYNELSVAISVGILITAIQVKTPITRNLQQRF